MKKMIKLVAMILTIVSIVTVLPVMSQGSEYKGLEVRKIRLECKRTNVRECQGVQ